MMKITMQLNLNDSNIKWILENLRYLGLSKLGSNFQGRTTKTFDMPIFVPPFCGFYNPKSFITRTIGIPDLDAKS